MRPDFFKIQQEQPETFAKTKREYIQQEINRISKGDKRRAWNLMKYQKTIDDELNKYKNNTARFNKMVELFWKGVGEFYRTLMK